MSVSIYLIDTISISEEHEPEAPGAAGHGVCFDGAVQDFSKLGQVVGKVFLAGVPTESTDEHFPTQI